MAAGCPCGKGPSLARCCGPYLKGAEPPDAESLMRSRYAAFATGHAEHLWRTLDASHPDRARDTAEVMLELRRNCRTHRYLGLEVREASGADGTGLAHVTFHVRVFSAGRDRSFSERSAFRHDGTGWRYVGGELSD